MADTGATPKHDIVIIWDPEVISDEMYAALVKAIGDLVRACGGQCIERVGSRTAFRTFRKNECQHCGQSLRGKTHCVTVTS